MRLLEIKHAIATLVLLAGIAWSATAFAAGTVEFVAGRVSLINQKGESQALEKKARVLPGDTILTGSDGEVHMVMDDQALLAMRANSRLRIDDYISEGGADDRSVTTVFRGFVRSVTGWIGKIAPRNYQMRTVNATVGIRGTDHEVGVVEEGDEAGSYNKVNEGETFFKNAGGEVTVKPGQAAFVGRGLPAAPKLLDRVPPIFKPTANEKLIDETKSRLASEVDRKLKERQAAQGDKRANLGACNESNPAFIAFNEFVAAYEAGNVTFIRAKLDPAMLGLQNLLDGISDDINKQKQIRMLIKDVQLQCGPDVTAIQFSWEKRFLDVRSFTPGLFSGRGSVLMHLERGAWNVAALAGDNPFAGKRGVLAGLAFQPGANFTLNNVQPAPAPLDLTLEVNDSDMAGIGTLKVQVVTSNGDVELFDLPELSPGVFRRTSVLVTSAPVAPGDGVLSLANGVSLTMRYVDQNPGNNMPPTLLTRSFKMPGTLQTQVGATPDPFAFIPVTQAPLSSAITSNSVVIKGITVSVPVSITGGSYSINGAAFTTAAGSITNGQSIALRVQSSSSPSTTTSATVFIGGASGTFSVTTVGPGTTPNPFTFLPQTNVPLSTVVGSNVVSITGINAPAPVSISGGQYSINGGAFTAAPGTITNGQTVAVQQTSSSAPGTTTIATLTIGGVSGVFSVTTVPPVTTPNPFVFNPAVNVAPKSPINSNPVTISGINTASPISVVGGSYSINGGPFTAAPGTITNGQTVIVQLISSSIADGTGTASATLNVGGVTGTFTATTWDVVPNAYAFANVSTLSTTIPSCLTPTTTYTTAPVSISGITGSAPVIITSSAGAPANPANAQVSINGGAFTAAATTITNGQTIVVRFNTVAAVVASAPRATISIGGVTANVTQTCR
jgi:hypothetical protein